MAVPSAKEIGGYLEFEHFRGSLYHDNAIALNCGCGCLAYLVELRSIKSIWLPDFMCDSVSDLFRREGVCVRAYGIGRDFLPVYNFKVGEGEWMLLADYYGQLREDDVAAAMRHCGGRLIVDETQGFFRDPWKGCDTVYSCRKWFGVADGGYLYTGDDARLAREIERDESFGRMGFVLGRFERPAHEFYNESKANNEHLAAAPMKKMSLLTENVLRAVDYGAVRECRARNFEHLHARLASANLLQVDVLSDPFMYPFMVKDAEGLRERLAQEGVFVPVLWPNVLVDCAKWSNAYRFAKNILPLPVDQRYGVREMERVASALLRFAVLGKCCETG